MHKDIKGFKIYPLYLYKILEIRLDVYLERKVS